ncbi:MAG: nucleotide sugar dehydrogenase [Verrucomicrobia bacterium]|nr:nucleotide sugar dehydrogenase [Verrucomicrobiota bacterium]
MIGFIGLSHLGLNYSLATAAKGFDVIAYDPDPALAAQCAAGNFPIEEPGFKELFTTHRARLHYTADAANLAQCDLVFYALDTRTNERNESDTAPLTKLIYDTAPALAAGTTVVLLSQVSPGYTRQLVADLEKRPDVKIRLFYYQVETLIFGAAVQRAMEPERFIVGALDPTTPLPAGFAEWHTAFKCPVLVMRLESAELAKIAINFFLVSTVSTTNTLAEVCEAIGADWNEIAPALRLDKRIGPHAYLKPGLGIAGGNLERDLVTVRQLAARHGTDDGVAAAWQANSVHRRDWVLRRVQRELLDHNPNPLIAVWGLAYKQDTHSIKNSPSIELIRTLSHCRIQAHDPAAIISPFDFPHVKICAAPQGALDGADTLLIMTPWQQYSAIPTAEIKARLKGRLVIDPYAALNEQDCRSLDLTYHRLGC